MEYAKLTALELSRRVCEREVSLADVAEQALAAAKEHQHGAYTCLTEDLVGQQVETLQARLDDPDFEPGPLFGVPCPIKDLAQLEGVPHEAGSAAYRGNVATRTDGLVTRLQQAGTLTIGKTATPELGLPCYTEPEGRPPAVTPWDPTRMAGGSSGGAAAAVAGGSVPLAHGSDGGGSIRIPASCCGLVGLKASRGVVSKGPYGVDGPGLVSEGVLSRTVRDTAAALDALSQPWPGDTFTAPATNYLQAVEAPVRQLRVGVLTEPVISADAPVHRGALNAVDRAARLLSELGHSLDEAPRPFPVEAWDAFGCVWAVGALSAPVPPEKEELLRPLTRWLRERGRHTTGVELAAALGGIQQLTRQTAEAWADFDVILTPTLAQPPLPVGALRNDDDPAKDFADQTTFTPWTSLYNLTGRPAISLPLHSEKVSGVELPFGVMLGANLFDDALLLSLGADLEDAAR